MTRLFTVAFEWAGFTFMQVGIYAVAFSPDDINGTLIAVTALIAAIGTAIVNIMAMREKRAEALRLLAEIKEAKEDARREAAIVRADVKEVAVDAKAIIAETKVIGGHVNSSTSVLVTTNDSLVKENADLRAQIADEKQRAALLAQAVASAGVAQHPVSVAASIPTPDVVSAIAQTTEDTKEIVVDTQGDVKTLTQHGKKPA